MKGDHLRNLLRVGVSRALRCALWPPLHCSPLTLRPSYTTSTRSKRVSACFETGCATSAAFAASCTISVHVVSS